MKAIWNGQILAQSQDTIVVEGNHYFPPDAIDHSFFHASDHSSVCPWKGVSHYYSITVGDQTNPNAAWFYPTAKEKAKNIEGFVAFWNGVEVVED